MASVPLGEVEQRLQDVMQAFPELNAFGMGVFHATPKNEIGETLARERAQLVSAEGLTMVKHCVSFLSAFTVLKTPQIDSYAIKHRAERWRADHRYVWNGAAIAAGLILEIPHKYESGPNALFAISSVEDDWVRYEGVKPWKGARLRQPPRWPEFLEERLTIRVAMETAGR